MIKPDRKVFEYAVSQFGVVPEETIFIDDTPANVNAASAVGLHGYQLPTGTDITALFIKS
jgi:HAD superfamily hydrolase (TIGR01509 family)